MTVGVEIIVFRELVKKNLSGERFYKSEFRKHCVANNGLGLKESQVEAILFILETKGLIQIIKNELPNFTFIKPDLVKGKDFLLKEGELLKKEAEQCLKIVEMIGE